MVQFFLSYTHVTFASFHLKFFPWILSDLLKKDKTLITFTWLELIYVLYEKSTFL